MPGCRDDPYWPHDATSAGAVAGVTGGAGSFIIAFLFFDMPVSTEVLVGLPVSVVAMVVVSLMTSPAPGERTDSLEASDQVVPVG